MSNIPVDNESPFMKAHIFERACPLYQDGALSPFFEGDMPP
jgi:hypothetical protein